MQDLAVGVVEFPEVLKYCPFLNKKIKNHIHKVQPAVTDVLVIADTVHLIRLLC